MRNQDILIMENITKVYPNGFVANSNVNFSLRKGEIHALAGENGAGKTTLMKILFGLEKPEKGEIIYNGKEININSPLEAIELGIGMVHQHFMLVPSLTVAENIMLGMEPKKGLSLNLEEMERKTEEISSKYNLPVPTKEKVANISVGMKQRVEILKTLAREAKVIILDEPTAVLTPQETEELFERLIDLKKMGHTIVFISHKLNEIKQICDRITVLRQGRTIITTDVEALSIEDISKLMIGSDLPPRIAKDARSLSDENVLEIKDLTYRNEDNVIKLENFNLSIKSNEIVGVAGIEGNGQRELSELITGNLKMNSKSSGTIKILNEEIFNKSIRELREIGVSHIPEDRLEDGSSYKMTIFDNIISDRYYLKEYTIGPLINTKKLNPIVDELISHYQVKCDDFNDTISLLSGGNIQKVVVAREFSANTKLIVANQPTRGIDIGSATFIRNKLLQLANENGVGVLLISADLDELLTISDTIIVMYNGRIVGKFDDVSKVDEIILGEYMLGIKNDFDTTSEGKVDAYL